LDDGLDNNLEEAQGAGGKEALNNGLKEGHCLG
jgi:hypothetical protein